jgi:hypothetical protein
MSEVKSTHKQPLKESENAPAVKKERKPREKYIPIAERFKTVGDIVRNERCQEYIDNRLKSITANRAKNAPGKGMRWKRGEYENLVEMGLWEAKAISQEFLLIDECKSKLASVLRRYIESLVIEGLNHTLEHYRAIEKERETKKAKRNEKTTIPTADSI